MAQPERSTAITAVLGTSESEAAMLDLESAQLFLDVVRYGSLSRAAEELYLSKSSVKKRIDDVEREVGSPLLVRGARGVEVTAAGSLFVNRMGAIFKELDTLKAECAAARQQSQQRVIRVAFYSDFMFPSIQYCCDRFAEQHPQDLVTPVLTRFGNAFAGVREGLFDVAFCTKPPVEQSAGISTVTLCTVPLVGMVSPRNPLASKTVLTRHDLAAAREVVAHSMWVPPNEIATWGMGGTPPFPVHVTSNGLDAMQGTCMNGGVYLYPESDVAEFPYPAIPLADPLRAHSVLVYPTNPSSVILDFVNEMVAYYDTLVDPRTRELAIKWSANPKGQGSRSGA